MKNRLNIAKYIYLIITVICKLRYNNYGIPSIYKSSIFINYSALFCAISNLSLESKMFKLNKKQLTKE